MMRLLGGLRSDRGVGKYRLGVVVATLFIAVATVLVGSSQSAHAQTYRFSVIDIEGNLRVEDATILSYAGIARGQSITAGQLNDAYQNIVDSGLFESVAFEPRGGQLLITVQEYPTINEINFEGNKRLDDEELATLIRSQSRRVYNPSLAEADAANIVSAYETSGRFAATVEPKIIRRSDNRVDLVFEIIEGKVIEIERLTFVGNRDYTDRRLRRVLATKQAGLFRQLIKSDTFVGDRIEFDKQVLRDFYLSRGYIDFQVISVSSELTRERDAFLITFNVREGQSFDFGEISVFSDLEEIDPDAYFKALNVKPGKTYSPVTVESQVARLERLAVQQGLDFIRVTPRITRNDRTLTLDVEFVIDKGPRIFVERIDIEGNATTLDRVIRRQFDTAEGDPFNPRAILQAAERIRALGFFATAEVNAREGSTPDQVIVDVDVEEQPTGTLSFGASYSATNGIGLAASFNESNFLGRGQTLGFTFNTGTDNAQYGFNFFEPAFLSRDVGFRFSGRYAQTDSQNSSRYDSRIISVSPSLEFPLTEFSRFQVRYTLEQTDVFNYSGTSTILAAEAARRGEVASKIGYTWSRDTRRTGLNPNAGVLIEFGQDLAVLGGDQEYIETTALVAAETVAFGEEVNLRAEFEGGLIHMLSGSSRVTDRYFLTGKMRGFDFQGLGPRDLTASTNDALGGNTFAVARFEADFPIGFPEEYGIRGGLFADVGSVWSLDNTAGGTVDDGLDIRAAVGVSIFWDTAIGPLRFNFSRALAKQSYDDVRNFDLTISTRF